MLVPAAAAAGAVLSTEMSALRVTVVLTVEELLPGFGSVVVALTLAVFETVPVAPGLMWTVMENVAEAPVANDASEHVIVPVPPTAGVTHENTGPVVCDSETNVVLAGTTSVSETPDAFDGPPFVSVSV